MKYLITKYKNNYNIIDILNTEFDNTINTPNSCYIKITNDKKVYIIHEYEVIDDYYLDIGAISHYEKEKIYMGKIIYESNDIIDIALKYNYYITQ